MSARYRKVVFDEWAMVALGGGRGHLLSYIGPRREGFKRNFMEDTGALREGLMERAYSIGDFEFARHGVGTGFEAFMVLGTGIYLICNHTVQAMDTIAKDPLWLAAQVPFVELSDRFRADPVVEAEPRAS